MAEARQAVIPLPSLTLDTGVDPFKHRVQASTSDLGFTVFIPAPRFLAQEAVRIVKRAYNKVAQTFVPLPVPVVFTAVAGTLTWVLNSSSTSFVRNGRLANLLWDLDTKMPFSHKFSVQTRVAYLTFNTTAGTLLVFTFFHRFFLRRLLTYNGWMDEVRGKKTSLKTTIWGLLLKYVYIRSGAAALFQYQTSLPSLPLPSLEDTIERYLKSMSPILSAEEMTTLREKAHAFIRTDGKKLQKYLTYKWWMSDNYISDWWLNVVYLRGRDSLMINSNYYGLSLYLPPPTTNQAARAAFAVHTFVKIKLDIDREHIRPTFIQGVVPLCMDQYRRAFSVNREPQTGMDRLSKYDNSNHIVVLHNGRWYKVKCFSERTGQPLSPHRLYEAFDGILRDKTPASIEELHMPALTAINRDHWATVRQNHFLRNHLNRVTLETIESAMFHLVLDTSSPDPLGLSELGHLCLHGNGHDRWFDKCFTLMIMANGVSAMHAEHSHGDAPTLGHVWELYMAREVRAQPYGPDGMLNPESEALAADQQNNLKKTHLHPERLHWHIDPELAVEIEKARLEAAAQITDLDLVVHRFGKFGKQAITKVAKCSPDAFVQMSLQLAYFRRHQKFVQTYESAMARLYLNGRTETIRSCSQLSCDLVRGIEEGKLSKEELYPMLVAACENHTRLTQLAMTGRGVDRHLFALYVVAVGTGVESHFLQSVMGRGWKLSTSQVPERQTTGEWDDEINNADVYPRASGGFGPVADDGYGVSYVISGRNALFFHVSSKKSAKITPAEAMFGAIEKALEDLMALAPPPELGEKSSAKSGKK